MGIFAKSKGARPSQGGAYFTPGEYKVMVNRIKKGTAETTSIEYCAIECVAIESDSGNPKPGQEATAMIMGNWKGAGSMLVDIGMAVGEAMTGDPIDPSDVDEASLEALAAAEQPAAGVILGLTVLRPKPGKQFCPHRWKVLDDKEVKRLQGVAKSLKIAVAA